MRKVFQTVESIFEKCIRTKNGCIEWTGSNFGPGKEYPCIWHNGRNWRGNRLMWTLVNGQIPEGLGVLHSCDNQKCVNPEHLRVGSHKENMQDAVNRKRFVHMKKTHCKNGHEFSKENTRISYRENGKKYRTCRRCMAMKMRERNGFNGFYKKPNATSKFPGVGFDKSRNRWGAYDLTKDKRKYIGSYLTESDAVKNAQMNLEIRKK